MEELYLSGRARLLGVSNMTLEQIERLYTEAHVRPHLVQNRCYATQGWDRRVRQFCAANGIVYQGFSLLTANRPVWKHTELARIARRLGRTVSQIIFRFAIDIGIVVLTGATNTSDMQEDLATLEFHLNSNEVKIIEKLASTIRIAN